MRWVFAYGSNMHEGDLERWFRQHSRPPPVVRERCVAWLAGWRLVWNYYAHSRAGGAANIEPCGGVELPGLALLTDVATYDGIAAKEGYPRIYDRTETELRLRDGRSVPGTVYFVPPTRCSRQPEPPTRAYLDLLIGGARQHDLPRDHVAALEATSTR